MEVVERAGHGIYLDLEHRDFCYRQWRSCLGTHTGKQSGCCVPDYLEIVSIRLESSNESVLR